MADRATTGANNTYSMSPAATLDRTNVVKFDDAHSTDTPKSPTAEKLNSQQHGTQKRVSLESSLEREIHDLPRSPKEGLFTKLLSYKWKSGTKDDGKNIC